MLYGFINRFFTSMRFCISIFRKICIIIQLKVCMAQPAADPMAMLPDTIEIRKGFSHRLPGEQKGMVYYKGHNKLKSGKKISINFETFKPVAIRSLCVRMPLLPPKLLSAVVSKNLHIIPFYFGLDTSACLTSRRIVFIEILRLHKERHHIQTGLILNFVRRHVF